MGQYSRLQEDDFANLSVCVSRLETTLRSKANLAALRYWFGLAGVGGLPLKRDLNPPDMVAFIRNVVLLDVRYDPLDFRYRLIGGTVRYHLRQDLTGKWMAEIPHNAAPSKIHSALSEVVQSKLPASTEIPYVGPRAAYASAEDLVMPLVDETGRITNLMATVDYFSRNSRLSTPTTPF